MRLAKAIMPALRLSAWQLAQPNFSAMSSAHGGSRRTPARLLPPITSRVPDWLRDGVGPTQVPTFFDDENRAGSSTGDRKVKATTAPMPDVVLLKWNEPSHAGLDTEY